MSHNLKIGNFIYLDPEELLKLRKLKIITKEEAEKIAAKYPTRQFVITEIKNGLGNNF